MHYITVFKFVILSHFLLDTNISEAAVTFWGSAGSPLGSSQHIWILILPNGDQQTKSVYWQFNSSKDVLPQPLALKGNSEDVKREKILILCLHCIFCNIIIAPPGVYKTLIVFPKEAGKKMCKSILASAQFFQPNKIKHASIAKLQCWPPHGLLLTHQLLSLSGVCSIWKGSFSVMSFVIKCSLLKMPGYWVGKCEQERFFLW